MRTAATKDARRNHPGARVAGFVALVVSLVIFAVSVLIALALPVLQKAERDARARTTAADLRTFDQAFQAFAHDHGDWPDGTPVPGAIPPGMQSALASTRWSERSPIGGRYVWLANTLERGERIRAAIAIVSVPGNPVTTDQRQLQALDRAVDDGNFRVGRLRLGFRNAPIYVMEH